LVISFEAACRKRVLEVAMSLIAKTVILLSMLTLVWADKVTVEITNTLEGKENLNVHCKSKNDDIGHHLLNYNQSFQWSFDTHFLWSTLFFCSFQWGNGDLLYFDVYTQTKDSFVCSDCHWYITKSGPCRYENVAESPVRMCYRWN